MVEIPALAADAVEPFEVVWYAVYGRFWQDINYLPLAIPAPAGFFIWFAWW
jgi:hypothetical protein